MKPHEETCPVGVGDKFTSMRNGKTVEVLEVRRFDDPPAWCAWVRTHHGFRRWVTCSKEGIKGYRRTS